MAAFAACILLVSCSHKSGQEIIPKNAFAKIYAEMFIADQWLNMNYKYNSIADTTLVYEPIFNKYGYTTDDYLASVDYYLYNPGRFKKIVNKALDIIERQQATIEGQGGPVMDENIERSLDEKNR